MFLRNVVMAFLLLGSACGPEQPAPAPAPAPKPKSNPNTNPGNTNPGNPVDPTCAEVRGEAKPGQGKKAVDVIFLIDNSCSMTEEIEGVERNINTHFAQILDASGLDYRTILLSKHGSADESQSICITAPLSGNASCSPVPSEPTNGSRFFHYDVEIGSTNPLSKVIQTYRMPNLNGQPTGGWADWLRPDSLKVFIAVTDDESSLTSDEFESKLFALQPAVFGNANQPNYIFHSIVGVTAKDDPTQPYFPDDDLVEEKCEEAVEAGENYQDLSVATGGLRLSVCRPDNFDTVFKHIAQGVVQSVQLACHVSIPPPPQGFEISQRIRVEYTPGNGGTVESFVQVPSVGACGGKTFYRDGNTVYLCPDACSVVQGDPSAKMAVLFTCEGGVN